MAGELTGIQGNDHTWPMQLRYKDVTDPENPIYTPWDLDDYTFLCQVRSDYADAQPTIAATMTVEPTVPANGQFNLVLSSEESVNLVGKYKYELVTIRTVDDYQVTAVSSTLNMKKRVTVVP